MTAPQRTPPASMTPYAPSWGLYIYGTRAFFTYGGRLVATATVGTVAQETRIKGVYARLTGAHDAHGGPATP